MQKSLSYDDVLLVPKYSDIRSRSEIDITGDLTNGLSLPLPIISSPMDTITETAMSFVMACMGGSGIIHRYNTIEEQSKMVREASAEIETSAVGSLGAAVGVTGDYIERAQSLVFAGVKYICVDIAHGHHKLEHGKEGNSIIHFNDNQELTEQFQTAYHKIKEEQFQMGGYEFIELTHSP